MFWLNYRTLHWLRGIAKLVAAFCTLGIGFVAKPTMAILASQQGPRSLADVANIASRHPYLAAGLCVALLLLAIAKFVEVYWLERWIRDAAIVGSSMRYLYGKLFGQNPDHRITFLAKGYPWDKYIRPRYRYAYGDAFQCKSRARFNRGIGFAGIAWDRPGGDKSFTHPGVPDLSTNNEAFLRYCEDTLNIPRPEAGRFGKNTQRARWFFTYGIVHPRTHDCIGVLSLDSSDPDALEKVDVDQVLIVASIIASLVKH